MAPLVLTPLSGIPAVRAGDDLAGLAISGIATSGERLQAGDVLVFAQKIVSKAEGRTVDLAAVTPSPRALEVAQVTGKDARLVELILQESTEVVRQRHDRLIVRHRLGFILANAGIDASNVDGGGSVLLLPVDPDASAARIRESIRERTGTDAAVAIIDSFGRPWRMGTTGTAIGVSGIPGLLDLRGLPDLNRRPLQASEIGFADELAGAASLVMGQAAEGTPIVLARGVPYARREGSAGELLRPKDIDLFR
jgi:coenzyme F420-0:L-glutamate ligase/coenzyme F420-1:gamma-L-glutamate ligase